MRPVKAAGLILGAMAAVIAVQMALTCAFDFHVGELFSRTALTALYLGAVCAMFRKKRAAG